MLSRRTVRHTLLILLAAGLSLDTIAARAFDAGKNEISISTLEAHGARLVLPDDGAVELLPYVEQQTLYRRGLPPAGQPAPLDYTPPIGSNKGSFRARFGGRAWATFPSSLGLTLVEVRGAEGGTPAEVTPLATLPAADAFRPGAEPVGIIAILIGQVTADGGPAAPVPCLVFRDAHGLFLQVFSGGGFRALPRETAAAAGLMEEEGIFFFLGARRDS